MRFLDAVMPSSQRLTLAEAYFAAGGVLGGLETFSVGGNTYTVPVQTTMPGQKAESIANSFEGYVLGGLQGNGVIFGLESVRMRVFSEARFQFQQFNHGRPGDLFGNTDLTILEHPWPGGVTGDLLAIMLLHADMAGNSYCAKINGQLVPMRPDWVEILLQERYFTSDNGDRGQVGFERVGYQYYQNGKNSGVKPVMFAVDQVAHFAPQPDPLANYRGMSWLTPVIREIQADGAMTTYKLSYLQNSSTPNLHVGLQIADKEVFDKWVETMENKHAGFQNAGKTLYTGAGADVTVIGSNMKELDFTGVVGRGETRLAQAAGVPPVVAGLSEGLAGSSLNAGNFSSARRQFADMTLSPLWRNAAGSLEVIVPPPGAARLWYDTRDIPFLRQDQSDLATIQQAKSVAIENLFRSGFEPDSIIAAVAGDDLTLLKHTGTFSVQVQSPGTTSPKLPSTIDMPPAGTETDATVKEGAPAVPAPAAPPA